MTEQINQIAEKWQSRSRASLSKWVEEYTSDEAKFNYVSKMAEVFGIDVEDILQGRMAHNYDSAQGDARPATGARGIEFNPEAFKFFREVSRPEKKKKWAGNMLSALTEPAED